MTEWRSAVRELVPRCLMAPPTRNTSSSRQIIREFDVHGGVAGKNDF